jgi:hypothetical protein
MVAVVKAVTRTASDDRQQALGANERHRRHTDNQPNFLTSGSSSAQHCQAETSNEGRAETQ